MTSNGKITKELLAINQGLLAAGKENADRFLHTYLNQEDKIVDCLKRVDGVKSEIYFRDVGAELGETLRFSSMFSDLILLNTATSPTQPSNITYFESQSPYWRDRKLTIPAAYVPSGTIHISCYGKFTGKHEQVQK